MSPRPRCEFCGRPFKRTVGDDGACWECRGWEVCHQCGDAKSVLDFSVYTKAGELRIAARCRECSTTSSRKYQSRAEIWRAYGLGPFEVRLVVEALDAYRWEQLRITRQIPKAQRVPHPFPPGAQFRAAGVPEARWRDLANALVELVRLEPPTENTYHAMEPHPLEATG